MSGVLSSKNGIRAKKRHECVFCEERINVGELYDYRCGINNEGDFFTMHMHPECQEKDDDMPYHEREEWYENPDGPLFDRPGKEGKV